MDCAARSIGCSTSLSPPRPTASGSRTSPTYLWRTAIGSCPVGLICARFRTWPASRSWAGKSGPPCLKSWWSVLCNAPFSPRRLPRTLSSTPTAVVPGRAGSIAATPTANYGMTTKPCVRRAAAVVPGKATAATTPYRVRPKQRAASRASKPKYLRFASGPFLPTWPRPSAASPIISTTTITSGCTPASTTRRLITLTNSFSNLTP